MKTLVCGERVIAKGVSGAIVSSWYDPNDGVTIYEILTDRDEVLFAYETEVTAEVLDSMEFCLSDVMQTEPQGVHNTDTGSGLVLRPVPAGEEE